MSVENRVYKLLVLMNMQELRDILKSSRIEDVTSLTVDEGKVIANEVLKEYTENKEESRLQELAYHLSSAVDGVEGALAYFRGYISELEWVESQIESLGNDVKSKPYILSHLIYKNVEDKKALARPLPLYDLVKELDSKSELRGIKGLTIKNIGNEVYWGSVYKDRYIQESVKLNVYKEQPEGRYLKTKKLLSKTQYIKAVKTYANWRGDTKNTEEILYISYLTQLVSFRPTKILTDKTKLFFGVLRESDLGLSKKIQTDDMFNKFRIYEEDGYTLLLRSRFVLIDNIRNQVIINKTPTEIAKKDVEMMVNLLTNKS